MKRLLWIDISKGLAILFVAYFHFFTTYFEHGVLPPADWTSLGASALSILRLAWLKVSGLGFPRSRCFHHPERLDADAIDHAPGRVGSNRMERMVSRAVPASLSDVLGRAFGLSSFALRCAPGASGRPHHPEPARSALHRYSDEFHVPQRGVVVLLHADPILSDFSPALSGGAPLWARGGFC